MLASPLPTPAPENPQSLTSSPQFPGGRPVCQCRQCRKRRAPDPLQPVLLPGPTDDFIPVPCRSTPECFLEDLLGTLWTCLSGTDQSRVACTGRFLHNYYEGNRVQGYGVCDRSPPSAACGTDAELSGIHPFTGESWGLNRALYDAWLGCLAGNYLFEACTAGEYNAIDQDIIMNGGKGSGPRWLQLGPAWDNYNFSRVADLPLWKGNRPAPNTDAALGIVLFLFSVAVRGIRGSGVWLCAHGPQVINSYDQFSDAQHERSLRPLWGSLEAVTVTGWHSWYTFDHNTWQWVNGSKSYETTVPHGAGSVSSGSDEESEDVIWD